MPKKKHVHKDFVRRMTVQKYEHRRMALKIIQNHLAFSTKKRFTVSSRLSKLKPTSSKVQIRNRCVVTGRSRGVYNYFKISRILIRELASKGLLPNVKKAS